MSHTDGVSFNSISPGLAADKAGMQKDIVYVEFNNVAFNDTTGFLAALTNTTPGQAVSIKDINGKTSVITLGANPKNESSPYLGVIGVQNDYIPNSGNWLYQAVYYIVFFFAKLTLWVYLLSLGIGLANLLPLGPVDGGRMLNIALIDINGKEKGTKWWAKISWITLFVLIILLVIPILRSLLFKA
jgi:membrane-associated protease RseP (regulator of RpoE activity)